MTDAALPSGEGDTILAAELAFGLLDKPERLAAEARANREPAFAETVARWRDWAVGLFADADQAPPAAVWAAIQARLPANDGGAADRDGRRQLSTWRSATALASAAALVFGVLALRPQPAPLPAVPNTRQLPPVVTITGHPLVAMLRSAGGARAVAVSVDPDRRGLTTTPTALALGAHDAELWVIPADGRPRSLGLVPRDPRWRSVPGTVVAALAAGATLAISVEPRGGSPTGQPTGKVILTAPLSAT